MRNLLPLAALGLFAAGGLALCSHQIGPVDSPLVAVHKDSFEVRVETVGTLDAARSFQVVSSVRGDRGKVVRIVDDGARVSPGDVLVRFDATPFENDVQRLVGETRAREALLEYARQNLEVEKSQVKKTLDNGEYDLISARQEHERFHAYIEDLGALAKKGYPVEGEIAQAKRKEQALATALAKAQTELERLARAAVSSVAKAAAEVNKAESELTASRAALATAQRDLESTEIRAPSAGFVVLNEIYAGTIKRKPRSGDTIWQGQPVLYLPDLSAMIVKTQAREEDLHKLKPGQLVTVRVEAYPDARFEGEVANVGVLAVETQGSAAGKYFQVTINLRGSDPRLRPGMTARVSIVADRVKDALVIPVSALYYEGGQPIAYVSDGSRVVPRRLTIGRRGDDLVEITEGLASGERVSLAKP